MSFKRSVAITASLAFSANACGAELPYQEEGQPMQAVGAELDIAEQEQIILPNDSNNVDLGPFDVLAEGCGITVDLIDEETIIPGYHSAGLLYRDAKDAFNDDALTIPIDDYEAVDKPPEDLSGPVSENGNYAAFIETRNETSYDFYLAGFVDVTECDDGSSYILEEGVKVSASSPAVRVSPPERVFTIPGPATVDQSQLPSSSNGLTDEDVNQLEISSEIDCDYSNEQILISVADTFNPDNPGYTEIISNVPCVDPITVED